MQLTKSDSFFSYHGVAVKVSGMNKTYRTAPEEIRALRGISWEVGAGQAVAIMGSSGCGKATLLNLLGVWTALQTRKL